MQVKTEENKKESTVAITVEVSVEEFEKHLDHAAQHFAKDVKIKGFREGKAPRKMIEASVGEQKIWEEAANHAVPELFEQAVTENKLEVLGVPKIEVVKLAPGNPFVFKAVAAITPDVKLPDLKQISVVKPKVEATDKDVDDFLNNLRQQRATYPEKKDGKVEKGDRTWVDFTVRMNKVVIEGGQAKDFPLTIGDGAFIPGFEEEVVGMTKGEEKTFELKFPEDYGKKDLAGKPADFTVKLNKIAKIELPVLDKEFAEKLGKFKSVQEMKEKLKENIKTEKESGAQQEYEMKVIEEIAKQTEVMLPEPLIESELGKMARELKENIESQGANFEDYLKSIGKKLEEMRESWRDQARQRVKAGLMLRAAREKQGIEVSKKEVEEEINMTLKAYPGNKQIEKQATSPAYHSYIEDVIANRKTIKYLAETAAKNAAAKK